MELVIPLLTFVVISTITPGPNNLLLATSGIRFGFLATVPHMIGIHFGVYLLVGLCGLGVGQLLLAVPAALVGLKIFGSVYLVYLAWKILGIRHHDTSNESVAVPMTVLEALIFQFSNPKAWMMATTGLNFSLAIDGSMPIAVLWLCLGFATLGLCCNCLWVLLGSALGNLWQHPGWRLTINGVLASLTIGAVVMFWWF